MAVLDTWLGGGKSLLDFGDLDLFFKVRRDIFWILTKLAQKDC